MRVSCFVSWFVVLSCCFPAFSALFPYGKTLAPILRNVNLRHGWRGARLGTIAQLFPMKTALTGLDECLSSRGMGPQERWKDDALGRQLPLYVATEQETFMASGKVKWWDRRKGYGFIIGESGKDVFVHYSTIKGPGYRSLDPGESVNYELVTSPKGLKAENVVRTQPSAG
jgi:cold shock protein